MKSNLKFLFFIFFALVCSSNNYAQVVRVIDNKGSINTVINNRVTEAADAPVAVNSEEGDIWLDTDTNTYFVYDGADWKQLNKEATTYETIDIGVGNQTINVRDADKIVGFTLISDSNSLGTNTGRMSGTWIIGDNRELIRCHMQLFEQIYFKYLSVSVAIDNNANEIVFTNYSSRYWTLTNTVPQNNLSNDQTNYRLGKIVIIRKE